MTTNQMRREAAKRKLERQRERRAQQEQRRRKIAVLTSVAVVVVVLGAVVLLTTLGGESGPDTETASAPGTVSCEYPLDSNAAKPVDTPPAADVAAQGTAPATIATSAGAIPVQLDRAAAPCTVNSFVSLARQGYYGSTPCHRLTTGEGLKVLQCGDPSGTGGGGPGYKFADETSPGLTYPRGTLAMANAGPDTNGSQFFLVYADSQLPPDYTVFGSISPEGLQVIDTVAAAGLTAERQPGDGAPAQPVVIENVTVQ